MPTRIGVERNVAVPMRDGTRLRADVYRPEDTSPVPAILVRLPYDKDELLQQWNAIHPIRAAESGYAVVFQDTRGRFRSEGDFEPYVHEGADGYDSVEWVARQPWCNGRVGMTGASYFGMAQWLAAVARPPRSAKQATHQTHHQPYVHNLPNCGTMHLSQPPFDGFCPGTLCTLSSRLAHSCPQRDTLTRGWRFRAAAKPQRDADACHRITEALNKPLKPLRIFQCHQRCQCFSDSMARRTTEFAAALVGVHRHVPTRSRRSAGFSCVFFASLRLYVSALMISSVCRRRR
jgi:putative CocE/NonD family hydrolase